MLAHGGVAVRSEFMSRVHLIAGEWDAILVDAAFAHPDPFLGLPVIIDAFPGDASGRDPGGGGVDAHDGAPGPRDLCVGVRRQPRRGLSSSAFGLAPPFEAEDRVVVWKPP